MPAKKNDKSASPSLDDLLAVSTPNAEEKKEDGSLETPEEDSQTTFDDVQTSELEALRAELAKAKEELAEAQNRRSERPVPESELSPEQRQIRQLQDELARTKGQTIGDEAVEEELSGEGILIHILEDGFHASYRGQEIVFGPKAYEETKNRYGVSWLNMTDEEQYERWGKLMFQKGPWPGKKNYEDPALANKSIRSVARLANY